MPRLLAASLAGLVSLVLFAAVFAAVSWFMRSTAFAWVISYPRAGQIVAVTTSVLWPTVFVPLLILSQRRRTQDEQAEQSELPKPAPRLWLRALQRRDH